MTGTPIVEVPANADFVIEGYVDPRERLRDEGPFGDRGQVRSANSEVRTNRAVNFNSTFCIRHSSFDRPATIVGIPPMEDFYIGGAALTLPATLYHRMGEGLGVRVQDELPRDRGHRAAACLCVTARRQGRGRDRVRLE